MGALISRWKAKPTTLQRLENIDKEIQEREAFRTKYQWLQKLCIYPLFLSSSVLYLHSSLFVYLLFLPERWLLRLAMALLFILYPVLVWLIWELLLSVFCRCTEINNDKLSDLKVSKKKILEDVMETETYKNAKVILERYAPQAKRKAELDSTPVRPQMTPRPGQEIQQGGEAKRYPVVDGPRNRYALICQKCCSHNGMALEKEFEYLAFHCMNCNFLNPARKTLPQARRLQVVFGSFPNFNDANFYLIPL